MSLFSTLLMAPAPGQDGGGSMISTILMFGAIGVIVYFFIKGLKKNKHPKIKRVKRTPNNKDV